jgi:hypothetical protein
MAETNEDRDGLVVYKGDIVEQVEDDTGKTLRRGIVVGHPEDGSVYVRWLGEAQDVRMRCAEIVVTPS